MSEKEDIIISKIGDVANHVIKLDDKIDNIKEDISESKVAIAGIMPRIRNLESRMESTRQKSDNTHDYVVKLKESMEKKIEESVRRGFQPLHDKVNDLESNISNKINSIESDFSETKKKMDRYQLIDEKFDRWQKEKDKDKFMEKMWRSAIATLSVSLGFLVAKYPAIFKVFGG